MGGRKELLEKLGGTIHARAVLGGDFKRCCMLSGEFDGSDRDYFFKG